MINLPFPNKSFLHKQLLDQRKSIDFTLWDALLAISNDRISILYGLMTENRAKLESMINSEKISRAPLTFPEKLRNYFRIRNILNEIYSHIHIILLVSNCIFEGSLISKRNKHFFEKNSFKRFIELMVLFYVYFI